MIVLTSSRSSHASQPERVVERNDLLVIQGLEQLFGRGDIATIVGAVRISEPLGRCDIDELGLWLGRRAGGDEHAEDERTHVRRVCRTTEALSSSPWPEGARMG